MLTIGLTACSAGPRSPDLRQLYERASSIPQEMRRPIIAVPGLLGSRLVDPASKRMVWGGEGLSLDPDRPEHASLLALPIGHGDEPLRLLRDDVRPDGFLGVAEPTPLGLPLEIDVYRGLLRTMITGGFDYRQTREAELARQYNAGSFEFPYDWRRDIVEAAQILDEFIKRKREQVRKVRAREFGVATADIKFDIVAHSMGTQVVRYYLMYGAQDLPEDGSLPALTWEGARNVAFVVLVAPPNAGSVSAFENLVMGKRLGALMPEYPPALLGTYPSAYQLMPRVRHARVRDSAGRPVKRLYDPALWVERGWGLADPDATETLRTLMPDAPDDETRRRRAIAHQARLLTRAEQFHLALDRPATPPENLDLFLVVGGGYATPAGALVEPDGSVVIDRREEGDGVVLRASALRRQDRAAQGGATPYRSVLLLPEEHLDIVGSEVFGDNLLYWLLEWRDLPELKLAEPRSGRLAQTAGLLSAGESALLARLERFEAAAEPAPHTHPRYSATESR
ncbi:MAG: hypothetical protein AAF844_00255 [Pseudomonadota bacterium]